MGHAASSSLPSLWQTPELTEEGTPFRWGILASFFFHFLVIFLAFLLRFQSDLERPFHAIEVSLISLPALETANRPSPKTVSPSKPVPSVSKAGKTSPPAAQKASEEPLPPLPTQTSSERLSDSIGGAVGSIKVPSRLEAVSHSPSPPVSEPLTIPPADRTPLIENLELPHAPPEISRPDRLSPPRIVKPTQPSPQMPPVPQKAPAKTQAISPSPDTRPIPKPPTLSPASPFQQTHSGEEPKPSIDKNSLRDSIQRSLPSVPPPMVPSTPLKKASPQPSHPQKTPSVPRVTAPQLAPIPAEPLHEPVLTPQQEKPSDSMKQSIEQLLAGVKAPMFRPSPPQAEPSKPAPQKSPTEPSSQTTLRSEIDQQLAKLTIPNVAPVESIQRRLQLIQVQSSPGPGSASSKSTPGENRYLAMVEEVINQRWVAPPLVLNNPLVVLKFRIAKSGEISQVRMEQSSGNEYYDLAAHRAVHAVNPLPPFPSDLTKSSIDVMYRFIKKD